MYFFWISKLTPHINITSLKKLSFHVTMMYSPSLEIGTDSPFTTCLSVLIKLTFSAIVPRVLTVRVQIGHFLTSRSNQKWGYASCNYSMYIQELLPVIVMVFL